MAEQTIADKYIPTAAEQKLIEVLCDPKNYGKSVTEICKVADISRDVYYTAIKKPGFVDYYNSIMLQIMKGKVGDVLKAVAKYAIEEPRCHQDRKMLLEMAGIYTEKKIQEITGKDGGSVRIKLEDYFSTEAQD
jgi:hypothetical protein